MVLSQKWFPPARRHVTISTDIFGVRGCGVGSELLTFSRQRPGRLLNPTKHRTAPPPAKKDPAPNVPGTTAEIVVYSQPPGDSKANFPE